MYAPSNYSQFTVTQIEQENNIPSNPKHQVGSFQNASELIATETYQDEGGCITSYTSCTTSPLATALSEQYTTSSSAKNSCSDRAAMMGRSYREATSRITYKSVQEFPNTPFDVAKNLLEKLLQAETATYKAQRVLQELSVLSLATAGFNLHRPKKGPNTQFSLMEKTKNGEVTPPTIGTTDGFIGKKKMFGRNDAQPKKIKQHIEFLNIFKTLGLPTLKPGITMGNTLLEHAEQLVYHGTMLLICTPTETLREHSTLVKKLATTVTELETVGKAGNRIEDSQVRNAQATIEEARAAFLIH